MAKIHMILQGEGGVGKSFIAATIAQYKASKGQKPLCIDTDPVNSTFHGYKALGVRRLEMKAFQNTFSSTRSEQRFAGPWTPMASPSLIFSKAAVRGFTRPWPKRSKSPGT